MLRLIIRWSPLDRVAADKHEELFARIASFMPPVLESALTAQSRALGIPTEDIESAASGAVRLGQDYVAAGEVFAKDGAVYVLSIQEAEKDVSTEDRPDYDASLTVAAITNEPEAAYMDVITEAVREIMQVELEDQKYYSDEFQRIRREIQEAKFEYQESDVKTARALLDRTVRSLAISIKQGYGLLVSDVERQFSKVDASDLDRARAVLEMSHLVTSEIVVICSRTGNQVMRAPSSDAIKAANDSGAKCACGKPLSEERHEEALTVTDLGKLLLDKSRWLSIIVMDELISLGVPRSSIIVEGTIGGDELDCLADINGELTLFELKDKEFNMGEAYSFGAKMSIINPRHSVIITSEYVGGDAKKHFQRSNKTRRGLRRARSDDGSHLQYIEGLDHLRAGLEKLVGAINKKDARSVLDEVLPMAAISSDSVISAIVQKAK